MDQQPRERRVQCKFCPRMTWDPDAICEDHQDLLAVAGSSLATD